MIVKWDLSMRPFSWWPCSSLIFQLFLSWRNILAFKALTLKNTWNPLHILRRCDIHISLRLEGVVSKTHSLCACVASWILNYFNLWNCVYHFVPENKKKSLLLWRARNHFFSFISLQAYNIENRSSYKILFMADAHRFFRRDCDSSLMLHKVKISCPLLFPFSSY